MDQSLPFVLLANIVLVLHAAIVLFVVGGLVLVVAGNLRSWRWVNSFWFRLVHLAAIAVVAAEALLGFVCPLTTLEMWLRAKAHATAYSGGFVEYWLRALLFWEASPWVFTTVYVMFGLLVLAAWWRFPPRSCRRRGEAGAKRPSSP